jgi:hypothetical protein
MTPGKRRPRRSNDPQSIVRGPGAGTTRALADDLGQFQSVVQNNRFLRLSYEAENALLTKPGHGS